MHQTRYNGLLILLILLFSWGPATAQLRYGIRAGLNFSTIKGPSEVDASGADLESWRNYTGFHLGVSFSHDFTDRFGLRGELLYNKLGTKYRHNGQMYRVIRTPTSSTLTTGSGDYQLLVSNTYITVPISAYGRFGDFEIAAGPYVSFLVQSVADGSLTYNGRTSAQDPGTGELQFNLLYNYRRDEVGEATGSDDELVVARVNGNNVELPKTLGAYYDYPEDRGNLYNNLDYGLVGGVSYFLSRTLFFSLRAQYGLADLTRDEADLSRATYEGAGAPVYRGDRDYNFVIQASIGFSF